MQIPLLPGCRRAFQREDLTGRSDPAIRKSKCALRLHTFGFQIRASPLCISARVPSPSLSPAPGEPAGARGRRGPGYHGNALSPYLAGRASRKPTSINPIKERTGLCATAAESVPEFTAGVYTRHTHKTPYILCLLIGFRSRVVDVPNLRHGGTAEYWRVTGWGWGEPASDSHRHAQQQRAI